MEKAYFAGGCFWCLEAAFKIIPGVKRVTSGYCGGEKENPSYEDVSSGKTGHAETVEIDYDPKKASYRMLLEIFFKIHDPSQKDRQGADVGNQYRSAIFYTTEEQKNKSKNYVKDLKNYYDNIYTQILTFEKFWPAEEYHQNYFEKNPQQAYCQAVVRPKVEKTKLFLKEKDGHRKTKI